MKSGLPSFVLGLLVCPLAVPALATQGVELALKGHCPVSYQTQDKAVPGDAAFRSVYQGYTYHLADADAKAKFDASPEKYAPQFAGLCTTALGGPYGNRLNSDPAVFKIVDGKLYMFSSERARRSFDTKPADYIAGAKERFSKPTLSGYCPVSLHHGGAPVKGGEKLQQTYLGRVYHFADQAAVEAFLKEPGKYAPAYDGFCAEGVSRGKRFPGDPKVFVIRGGRTYFFFDEKGKQLFEADPAKMIQAADAAWPELRNAPPTP